MNTDNLLVKKALETFPNFVIVDADGVIAYMNNIYAEFLGTTQEQAIGKPVEDVIPNTRMREVLRSGKPEIGEIMTFFDHVKQEQVSLVCNRYPITHGGKIIGALAATTMDSIFKVEALHTEVQRIRHENKVIREKLELYEKRLNPLEKIIGASPQMRELKQTIEDYAKSNLSILITGETGVGKEVFANAIHQLSNRALNNYVKINCAAIPENLLESELFGYAEGAFSGAKKGGKIGKFELANNGTILLDEIGEMPLDLQTKLLRVIQENELERVGSNEPVKLNVRFVASTNCDIEELVSRRQFREDLYYRLNVVELFIPPLRSRKEDILGLCRHFISRFNEEDGLAVEDLSPAVLDLLKSYSWPGNVRELQHVVHRAMVLCQNGIIGEEHCRFFQPKLARDRSAGNHAEHGVDCGTDRGADHSAAGYGGQSLRGLTDETEKKAILQALAEAGNNKSKAAQLLNLNRSMLYTKMKKYEIDL